MSHTPNMDLDLPVVTETTGPEWANKLNEALNTVDGHNHTPGFGVQVPTAGLNIDADVDFNGNAASDVKSIALTSQNADDQTHLRNIYSKLGDLWYNNEVNQAVQITDGSSLAGGGGGGGTPVVVQGEIFVSKNGNDSTGTGSATAPFLTIGQALLHAAAMYAATDYVRINVGPGVYAENVMITRHRTVILGANTAPEELTTVISGYVSINCPSAASKYQDVIGLTGIQINCTSSDDALQVLGTGLFLVSINECYITTGTTNQYAVSVLNTNATRCAVYFKNSIVTRYANASTAGVMLLSRGDVRIDNVRVYASVTGSSTGIDILNNATLFANNLLIDKSTSGAGISIAASTTSIPLVLSNSSISVSYGGASGVSAISIYNSLGAGAFIYNSLLTVNVTGAGQYAIAGAPPFGVSFYYSELSFGGLNSTVSPVVSGAAVQLPRLGITPVANGGTGLSAPGTAGNVLTSNGTAWVSSTPTTPAALANWTEAQAAFGGKTIDSFTAVASGSDADAAVVAKGSGALLAQIPDGTATGGNIRGQYAVDWQHSRSVSNRVASGNYSVVGGGSENTASGLNSTVAGGASNGASGQYSTIAGGSSNTAGTNYSAVVGGQGNGTGTYGSHGFIGAGLSNNCIVNPVGGYDSQYWGIVSGESNEIQAGSHSIIGAGIGNDIIGRRSVVGGGKFNKTHGDDSVIPGGFGADTRGTGGRLSFASGNPEVDYDGRRGNAQMSIIAPFRDTSDATPTQLTTDGNAPFPPGGDFSFSNGLVFAASAAQNHYGAMKIRAEVIARNKNTGVTDVAAWTIEGIATRTGTAASTAVTSVTSTTFGTGLVGSTATLVADTTSGGVAVEVTGLAGTNIRWCATIYATEIKIY